MKLKDVKHLIDAHFDAMTPMELVRRLESLGYEFEPREEMPFPQTVADFFEIASDNHVENILEGKTEEGIFYINKKNIQSATPTDYADNYQYAMAA